MSLKETIRNLIDSKREGNYWDFKQEPHSNKASLLHDIICLANAEHKGKRYLIYGVQDPDEGADIIGLSDGQENRKRQANFIDFLRGKKFAGERRPEIELTTIELEQEEIDVLTIYDNPFKPYYLIEDYRDQEKVVKANYIYTRSNDTNTPINRSADIGKIEKMWRERFGLDVNPLEKMQILLEYPDEWMMEYDNQKYAFHKQFPEYKIEFTEPKEFWEVYSSYYLNNKSYVGDAIFKYHTTTLFKMRYVYCDEMNIMLPEPESCQIIIGKERKWFFYFLLDDLKGQFLHFLTDGALNVKSRTSSAPFLLFKNEQEKRAFIKYLKQSTEKLKKIKPSYDAKATLKRAKIEGTVDDPIFVDRTYQLFENWKKDYRS